MAKFFKLPKLNTIGALTNLISFTMILISTFTEDKYDSSPAFFNVATFFLLSALITNIASLQNCKLPKNNIQEIESESCTRANVIRKIPTSIANFCDLSAIGTFITSLACSDKLNSEMKICTLALLFLAFIANVKGRIDDAKNEPIILEDQRLLNN